MSNKDTLSDLISKMGKSSSSFQNTDAKSLINMIETAPGSSKSEKLQQTLNELQSSAQGYNSNKKFREAAHLFYLGGMVTKYYYPQNKNDFGAWFKNAINNLISLSEEYMTWKEVDRASAVITIANLLHFFTSENWELEQYYSDFLSKYGSQVQQGKTASGSLWVPNYIVSAIKELNPETLQQADQYAQMYLLAEAKTTNHYKDAVVEILNLSREKLSKSVKIPSVKIDSLFPKDVLFGENFELILQIYPQGEGQIKNASFNLSLPDELIKRGDNANDMMGKLNNNQEANVKVSLTSKPSTEPERDFSISGSIQFEDMLGNLRSFPIGPFHIILRSFRKGNKLTEQLTPINNELNTILSELDSFEIPETFSAQKESLKGFFQNIIQITESNIKSEKFESAENLITLLNNPANIRALKNLKSLFSEYKLSSEKIDQFNKQIENILETNQKLLANFEDRLIQFKKIVLES